MARRDPARFRFGLSGRAQAEQLASRLGTLLGGVAADPSVAVASLPQLDAAAREQVLSQFGEGPAVSAGADQLVHDRVADMGCARARRASRSPTSRAA